MKINVNMNAIGEVPRYFRELWHQDTKGYSGHNSRISWMQVLAIWWIIECHTDLKDYSKHKVSSLAMR
jgi:hypothetical protein